MVGVVSVAMGISAMALLISQQDRIRTLRQERACQQGDPRACLHLESTYRAGKRVAKDDELADAFHGKAVQIHRADCEARDAAACFQLGVLLTETAPSLRDERAAARAFERACEGGVQRACRR